MTLGQAGDIPIPGDYDGDGDTDPAIYRPSTGLFFGTDRTGATVPSEHLLRRPPETSPSRETTTETARPTRASTAPMPPPSTTGSGMPRSRAEACTRSTSAPPETSPSPATTTATKGRLGHLPPGDRALVWPPHRRRPNRHPDELRPGWGCPHPRLLRREPRQDPLTTVPPRDCGSASCRVEAPARCQGSGWPKTRRLEAAGPGGRGLKRYARGSPGDGPRASQVLTPRIS